MDWPTIASVATAFGLGTVIAKAVEAFTAWRAGRHRQAQDGWTAADRANRKAQMTAEALYETRLYCHREHGTPFKDLPDMPEHMTRPED